MSLSTQVLIDLFEAVEPLVSEASREKLAGHRRQLQEDVSPPADLDVKGAIAAAPWHDYDCPGDPDGMWHGLTARWMPMREVRVGDRYWSVTSGQWIISSANYYARTDSVWVKQCNPAYVANLLKELERARSR